MKIKVKLSDKTKEELKGLPGIKGDKGDKPVAGVDFPLPKDGESIKGDKGDPGKDGTDAKLPKKIGVTKIDEPIKVANPYDDKEVIKVLKDIEKKDLSVNLTTEKIDTSKIEKTLKEIRDKPTISSISGGGGGVKGNIGLKNVAGTQINPATSDKQLPDNHQVTVSNPTTNPETGLAKEVTLGTINTNLVYADTDAVTVVSLLPDGINVMPSMDTLARAGYQLTLDMAMAKRVDWASTTVCYTGWASPGVATSAASWRVRQRTFTGDDFVDLWADGDSAFNNVWDNRLTLNYS